MITEFAQIEVKPGMQAAFIEGVEKSRAVFMASKGCAGLTLQHSIEEPTKFVLMVQWGSVDDHMVSFRESENYQIWRGNVGHYFAAPPVVWHGQVVA